MKAELIDKLYEEFDKDREIIKDNLLKVMDTIILQTEDNNTAVTLTIHIESK